MSATFVSLFSGCMGLDLGLEQAGFKPLFANELDAACRETIRLNRPVLPVYDGSVAGLTGGDVRRVLAGREIDVLAGGPPCQSFSVYGNRRGATDRRGRMVFEFLRLVFELRPKAFLMENVRGLHSMLTAPSAAGGRRAEKGSLLKLIMRLANRYGYQCDCFLVNSVNYGSPQIRERLLLFGNRTDSYADFPAPTRSNRRSDGLPPFATLAEAIGGGFVDPDPSLMDFSRRKLHYLAMVPPGGNWRSLPVDVQKESMGKSWYLKGGRSATWRRLAFDFPSPTVVTMPNHASTSMCHPAELRALTVGECAAIQEFPPDWRLAGTTAERYRQVGNAVPVRLGEVAGRVLLDLLARPGSRPQDMAPARVMHLRPHVRARSFFRNGAVLRGDCYYSAREQVDPRQPTLFTTAQAHTAD